MIFKYPVLVLAAVLCSKGAFCDLTSDIAIAQEKLAILEKEKSDFATTVLTITTQHIDVQIKSLVAEIVDQLHFLNTSEEAIATLQTAASEDREAAFRSAFDLSYLSDVFGNVAQEVGANLATGQLDTLQQLHNDMLMYLLRLTRRFSYFRDSLTFEREKEIILEAVQGQGEEAVAEILMLVAKVEQVLSSSVESLELGGEEYSAAINQALSALEIIIDQLPLLN